MTILTRCLARVQSKRTRLGAEYCFQRRISLQLDRPLISFSFDDFPRTALVVAGSLLQEYELRGTYYVSLGLAGRQEAAGSMFDVEDLSTLLSAGHELGCHTFDHCDSGLTSSRVFQASVLLNARRLKALLPAARFRSFSFPKRAPRIWTKRAVSKYFECCRSGGQTYNAEVADVNYLRAFFLEQARGDLNSVKRVIDENCQRNGWLIFATHDVCEVPSVFGCTPAFFQSTLAYAISSGALILPVAEALDKVNQCRTVCL